MSRLQAHASGTPPRVLIVTPEITYLPSGMGNRAHTLRAKAGGLADVSAGLVSALFEAGADVHVALPHYRRMFHIDVAQLISEELRVYQAKLPTDRIHLAEDRIFYYRDHVYGDEERENQKIALAFQREVLNNILPRVRPHLVHVNDWMTGLIPAAARRLSIPCLFTVHNVHTTHLLLETIEDAGIDAAGFWTQLYYQRMPVHYAETRAGNPVDLLASGLFASHFINTVSPTFLREIVEGRHMWIPRPIRDEILHKVEAGCAVGILNAPDARFCPQTDARLPRRYGPEDHPEGKLENKRALQAALGLVANDRAPMFFWPSRLDPTQKGCELMAHILYDVISTYWAEGLQLVFVADGFYQRVIHDIVRFHDLATRVAVCDFDEDLSHLAYAGADFILVPSRFEPCGLPQMIGARYGALPVAHDTGGLHDTVEPLDVAADRGNGFLFRTYDPGGLRWAIGEAMRFYRLDPETRARQIARIMREGAERFNLDVCARQYMALYERMLKRPLVPRP